jgi:hypothetical protein
MRYPIFLLALSAFFCRCHPPTEEERSEINFAVKKFRVESTGGCSADTMHCAYYEVTYPEFAGLDTAVLAKLRRLIAATVSMGNPEADGKTMKQTGDTFIQSYQDFKNDIPESAGGWYYAAEVKVETLVDTLLSLSVQEAYFTGGAHGGHGTYFINISPKTGAAFTLDTFFKTGYYEPLTKLGEKVFRQVKAIPDTASLDDNGFEFPDDAFQLNTNYGFKKEGIVFYYNSYEIAPYAAGPTEVMIPYELLVNWIR